MTDKKENVATLYKPKEEVVLDPSEVTDSLLERMPNPTGWRILVLERRLPLSDAPLCCTLLRHSHFLPASSHLLGGFRLQVLGEPDTCADDSVFV